MSTPLGEPWESLLARAKGLASGFATYSAFASFALYVFGYLALRYHLTVLGVGTDLSVLDERYLFAGARFLVYLGSMLPIAVLVGLFIACVVWLPYRCLPRSARATLGERVRRFAASPAAVAMVGIVLALAVIQGVMRQCFLFSNLLVGGGGGGRAAWLERLFVEGIYLPLFFSGLLLGVLVTGLLWGAAITTGASARLPRAARGLLGVLLAIQILLLPVNFGVLVLDNSLPRVTAVGAEPLPDGDRAWLVWEGKEAMTYLVKRKTARRSLLSIPRVDVKRTEITGYDRLPVLLASLQTMEDSSDAKP